MQARQLISIVAIAVVNYSRCFQLMRTNGPSLFDIWIQAWRDLSHFEINPRTHFSRSRLSISQFSFSNAAVIYNAIALGKIAFDNIA
ncbi:DUF3303 domain-containing protein [Chroococcidiopsis sp. TS-821]|uniref:DUF3303 domain-containing protein n=1 Tax=Chroococcidiopsis sp. TS-821 TaxID=1378066 RepID=UPI001AEFCD23|nr:DUF3303 family protein [Chroococcidiopsis sp. TS-821]